MYSVTSGLVGSVDLVVGVLVVVDSAGHLVEEEDNLIFGGLSLEVGLDSAQDHGSEGVFINLSQDSVSVLVMIVNVGSS